MKPIPGKNVESDRVALSKDEQFQLDLLMKDEKWSVYRRAQLARCAMVKSRLYSRALSGTKDFDVVPLVAYLSALEDSLNPTFLVEEKT